MNGSPSSIWSTISMIGSASNACSTVQSTADRIRTGVAVKDTLELSGGLVATAGSVDSTTWQHRRYSQHIDRRKLAFPAR